MSKNRLNMDSIKTDPELLEKIKQLAKHKMTPEEALAQKRSWVIGEMGLSNPDRPIEEIEASVDKMLREQGYKI